MFTYAEYADRISISSTRDETQSHVHRNANAEEDEDVDDQIEHYTPACINELCWRGDLVSLVWRGGLDIGSDWALRQ